MPEDVGRTGEIEMPARKRRPPLVTRDQVIDTAYRLVDEEGPRGLSMRRLAGALHVSLPTVYTAIDSREALVERLLDRLVDEIADDLALGGEPIATSNEVNGCAPVVRSAVAVQDDLLRRGRALLDWALRRPNLTAFLLAEEIGSGVADRAVRGSGTARRAAAMDQLRAIVGPDARDVDPVVAVMVVVAEGRAALWLARQERLAGVGAEHWIDLGCRNVACALQTLAATTPVAAAPR